MKIESILPLMLISLLTVGCAAPSPQSGLGSTEVPVEQQQKEAKQGEDQSQQAIQQPVVVKTIVPDINEQGVRGEMARKMMEKSTRLFLKADMDRDLLISADEARQHIPYVSREFVRYDKNNDAGISWEELLGHDKWPAPVHGSEAQ